MIAYLLIVIGFETLLYQGFIVEGSGTSTLTILAGAGYYAGVSTESSMWMNAHLEGTIEMSGGGALDAIVLGSAQYEACAYNLEPSTSL